MGDNAQPLMQHLKTLGMLRKKLIKKANEKCDPVHSLMVDSENHHSAPTGVKMRTDCWNKTESPIKGTNFNVKHSYNNAVFTKELVVLHFDIWQHFLNTKVLE